MAYFNIYDNLYPIKLDTWARFRCNLKTLVLLMLRQFTPLPKTKYNTKQCVFIFFYQIYKCIFRKYQYVTSDVSFAKTWKKHVFL